MNEEYQKDIKSEVLKKIETGEIKMKSRMFFMFKFILTIIVSILVAIFSIFLLSFVIFSLNIEGSLFLIRFGGQGIYNLLFILPWYLLIVDILLLILLDMLLKSFKFGYKSPLLYLFIGTLFIATVISMLINFTSFHQVIMSKFNKDKIFVINPYSKVRSDVQKPGTWKGYVESIEGDTFIFRYVQGLEQGGIIKVYAKEGVDVGYYLNPGDLVFVAGNMKNDEIIAYGIKKLGY